MTEAADTSEERNREEKKDRSHRVCPWWMGYMLTCPLRDFLEKPERILAPLAKPSMTAVDIGSAMGFFSLPLARLVGPEGRVVCVDIQNRMLKTLERRARRRGLDAIISTHLSTQEGIGLDHLNGQADLVLAVHMIHETEQPERFIEEATVLLKAGGHLLVAEPAGHVSPQEFEVTRQRILAAGLEECEAAPMRKSLTALFRRAD